MTAFLIDNQILDNMNDMRIKKESLRIIDFKHDTGEFKLVLEEKGTGFLLINHEEYLKLSHEIMIENIKNNIPALVETRRGCIVIIKEKDVGPDRKLVGRIIDGTAREKNESSYREVSCDWYPDGRYAEDGLDSCLDIVKFIK